MLKSEGNPTSSLFPSLQHPGPTTSVTSCDQLKKALPPKPAPPQYINSVHQDLENIHVATEHDLNNVIAAAIFAEETIPQDTPIKAGIGKYGLMQPNSYAMSHEAIPMLKGYEENGCPVDCGDDWSRESIQRRRNLPHNKPWDS